MHRKRDFFFFFHLHLFQLHTYRHICLHVFFLNLCRNFITIALDNVTTQTNKVSNFADRLHGMVHIVNRFATAAATRQILNQQGRVLEFKPSRNKALSGLFLSFLGTAAAVANPTKYPFLIRLLAEDAKKRKDEGELSLSLPSSVKSHGFHLADVYLCVTRLTASNKLPPAFGTYYYAYSL